MLPLLPPAPNPVKCVPPYDGEWNPSIGRPPVPGPGRPKSPSLSEGLIPLPVEIGPTGFCWLKDGIGNCPVPGLS